jgi:hypothetical protein
MNVDPIKPYADLIRIGLIVGFLVVFGGASAAAGYQFAESGNVKSEAIKDKRIFSLEASLGDFITLYDRVNAATQEQLKFAEDQRKADKEAAAVALKGEELARKEADQYEARWIEAAKRKPDCAALRAMNMEAVCGIPLR